MTTSSLTSIEQLCIVLIPIFSIIIGGLLTYRFGLKSKKFDLLYASKIPAFKEIAMGLTEYKSFCWGRVAYYKGNDISPYYSPDLGALLHRTAIAKVADINSIFLSKENRNAITNLLNNMSILCNIELLIESGDTKDYSEVYQHAAINAEALIEMLYHDLNLKLPQQA